MVRRLPVVQSSTSEDDLAATRPSWHWVLIGAGFCLTLFMPLAAVAIWLSARFALGAAPILVSFALACFAAGVLVGRFGGRSRAGIAALGGLVGALLTWALAALGRALSPWPVAVGALIVLAGCAYVLAWLGGRLGVRIRPRLDRAGA